MRPVRDLLAVVLLLASSSPSFAASGFEAWLDGLRADALADGISAATLDAALVGVAPIPRVIELDRKQPEFTMSFERYLERVVPERRVRAGKRKLAEHRELLEQVSKRYGVQPRFIVALWGIESDFGRLTGGFSVVPALATLAYDGRRSAFFRKELLAALHILEEGHVSPERMTGSWAGAMGQPQFMPSSFRRLAVDFDGDGRRDIWDTPADVFASAANYLSRAGWHSDQTWGREVKLPDAFDRKLIGLEVSKGLNGWQALGVRRADGTDLPTRNLDSSLVQPGGPEGPTYVVYGNYHAVLAWNRSDYFATAVGILADRIGH